MHYTLATQFFVGTQPIADERDESQPNSILDISVFRLWN